MVVKRLHRECTKNDFLRFSFSFEYVDLLVRLFVAAISTFTAVPLPKQYLNFCLRHRARQVKR